MWRREAEIYPIVIGHATFRGRTSKMTFCTAWVVSATTTALIKTASKESSSNPPSIQVDSRSALRLCATTKINQPERTGVLVQVYGHG